MRIRFGLTLKITVQTKFYKPLKQHYFTKPPESQAKLPLFSGSHPNYSIIPAEFCSAYVSLVSFPSSGKTPARRSPFARLALLLISRHVYEISSFQLISPAKLILAYHQWGLTPKFKTSPPNATDAAIGNAAARIVPQIVLISLSQSLLPKNQNRADKPRRTKQCALFKTWHAPRRPYRPRLALFGKLIEVVGEPVKPC